MRSICAGRRLPGILFTVLSCFIIVLFSAGCTAVDTPVSEEETKTEPVTETVSEEAEPQTEEEAPEETGSETEEAPDQDDETTEESTMRMTVNGTPVFVEWEDNGSVKALMELVREAPLTISMSMYGGFEQVGPIGRELPRDDERTTTKAGDIVLYSGDQIVVFYGSNTWAYTRLGRITDKSERELADLLGNRDAELVISMG